MRRPWAVRSFCVRYMTDTVAAGRRKSALTSAELYGGFTNSPLYKNRAPRVFSVNLRNILLGQSRTIPATCVSRRRLLVYSTGRRLRNSKKNVADFNFELLIIYQVYCIIIVTREKRFARKGTRATTESLCATGLRRF